MYAQRSHIFIVKGHDSQHQAIQHAKFVMDNKLAPGTQILLIRSGDVIPKIQKVLKNSKSFIDNNFTKN